LSKAAAIQATGAIDHFLLGEGLRRQDDLPDAIREFESVLQAQPDHFWAHYLLAVCFLPQEPRAAKAHLTACLSQRPDFGWCYLQRGIAHGQLKDYRAAENDFESALSHPPQSERLRDELRYAVLVNRAVLRTRQGQLPTAEEDLHAAISFKPNPYQAYWNLANIRQKMSQPDAAIEALGMAIDSAQALVASGELDRAAVDMALLYYSRAQLRAEREDWDRAVHDLSRSIEVQPIAEGYALQGQILQQQKQYADAATAYEQALQSTPVNQAEFSRPEIHRKRAEVLLKLADFNEARRSLDFAAEESERAPAEVYRLRGLVRAKLGDYAGAVSDYTQALAIAPDDPLTYEYRGRVYLVQEAFTPAWDDFEKAIALNPAGGDAYNGRAYIYARRGQPLEAIRDVEEALRRERQREGENPQLLWNAALIHALAVGALEADAARGKLYGGRIPEQHRARAMELLRRALDLTPVEERAAFWRNYVQPESAGAFASLAQAPEYVELEQGLMREE
jgi:tetratricopeptide (TPR) repeat protein